MIGLSIDSVADHKGWIEDIKAYNSLEGKYITLCYYVMLLRHSSLYYVIRLRNSFLGDFPFPIIADDRTLAVQLNMLDPDELDKSGMPLTARAVFIIGPDKKLKLSLLYPATTGRNFDEIIRVLKSLQLTANHKVATPANWNSGQKCMVVPGLTDEQANERFKAGFEKATLPSGKGYIRTTPDPSA